MTAWCASQLHDEAQGVVRRQGAEGLRRKRMGVPAVGDGVPMRGGRDRVRVAVVGETVAVFGRSNRMGMSGIINAVGVCP